MRTTMRHFLRLTLPALLLVPAAGALPLGVGLSPVRSLFFHNPLAGDDAAEDGDQLGGSLAVGDFDGDGFDDLAAGVPLDDGPNSTPVHDAGSVLVFRGHAERALSAAPPIRLAQAPQLAAISDLHGYALAASDFDDDGFDDLAVGAPGETFGAAERAGAVYVYAGSATGLSPGGFTFLRQGANGMPQTAEDGDFFGLALACGDFDADGFADLAAGAPSETIGTQPTAGWAVAIPGSPTGLVAGEAVEFLQLGPSLPSEPESGDEFGGALAAGDLDGDGFDDLAIGVPGEDLETGAAHVVFGSAAGPTAAGSMLLTEEALGGISEAGDRFAHTNAFGDFDADGFDDLVVGIPRESFAQRGGPIFLVGQTVAVYGGPAIPTVGRVEFWGENSVHGPGSCEDDDAFGEAIATGDFDRDGFDDLAVGHPTEAPDGSEGLFDGAVSVFVGSAAGLTAARERLFAPGTEGVPGSSPNIDRYFGFALAAGDFDGDGYDDVAVGAPLEVSAGGDSIGAATLLRGALFADGFETELPFLYWRRPMNP